MSALPTVSYSDVPASLVGPFFPPLSISIPALLSFNLMSLPNVVSLDSKSANIHSRLVTTTAPDCELSDKLLRSIVPLPLALVHQLLDKESTCHSISHDGHHLPPKVLSVWSLLGTVHQIRARWRSAMTWMRDQERHGPAHRTLIDDIRRHLRMTAWGGFVKGFEASGSVSMMAFYASKEWLSDLHTSQLCELLLHSLDDGIVCDTDIDVVDPLFASKLLELDGDFSHPWISRISDNLVSGRHSQLLGLLLVNRNHWIAYAVDLRSSCRLLFGDSFGNGPPKSALDGLRTWISSITGKQVQVEVLTCTAQTDSFSCGILAMNALHHFVDPEENPILTDAASIKLARLKAFKNVLSHHLDSAAMETEPALHVEGDVVDPGATSCEIKMDASAASEMDVGAASEMDVGATSEMDIGAASEMESATAMSEIECAGAGSDNEDMSEDNWIPPTSSCGVTDDEGVGEEEPVTAEINAAAENSSGDRQSYQSDEGDAIFDSTSIFSSKKAMRRSTSPELRDGNTSLTRYYPRVNAEEHQTLLKARALKRKREEEDQREEREQQRQRVAQAALIKSRTRNNERKQKQRTLKKADEIEKGVREADGKLKKKKAATNEFTLDGSGLNAATDDIAEASRPFRQYKNEAKRKPQGRKKIHEPQRAKRTNWQVPFLWSQIQAATTKVGYPFSPVAIVKELQSRDPRVFAKLYSQTMTRWMNSPRSPKQQDLWNDSTLKRVAEGNKPRTTDNGLGVLKPYPELAKAIMLKLKRTREVGVALALEDVSAILISMIKATAPEVFMKVAKDGSTFRCSDSFVRHFLSSHEWSRRTPTKAAQKMPDDAQDQCRKSFLRQAITIRDDGTKPYLRANGDQTQAVVAQGTKYTWNEKGPKQVAVVSAEEKRAFTLMVGVTASGEALPFQAIYKGKTNQSLPVETPSNSEAWKKAMEFGFLFEASGTDTYWSTLDTMKSYVNKILAPYFVKAREAHGDPADQLAIWQIDAWSVHRSAEFRAWMAKNHPTIQLEYVPGGCTGIWQPCDVGIQRLLKHELQRAARADVIAEALQHIEACEDKGDIDTSAIQLDKRIGVLRNRSVGWLVRAYEVINHPEFVQKAFEHCQLDAEPHFNLSHASLTSAAALQALKNVQKTDARLWAEISRNTAESQAPPSKGESDPLPPDEAGAEDPSDDDLSISSTALRDHMLTRSGLAKGFVENPAGKLTPASISETLDDAAADTDHEFTEDSDPPADVGEGSSTAPAVELGRGKRAKKPNQRYTDTNFWEEA